MFFFLMKRNAYFLLFKGRVEGVEMGVKRKCQSLRGSIRENIVYVNGENESFYCNDVRNMHSFLFSGLVVNSDHSRLCSGCAWNFYRCHSNQNTSKVRAI